VRRQEGLDYGGGDDGADRERRVQRLNVRITVLLMQPQRHEIAASVQHAHRNALEGEQRAHEGETGDVRDQEANDARYHERRRHHLVSRQPMEHWTTRRASQISESSRGHRSTHALVGGMCVPPQGRQRRAQTSHQQTQAQKRATIDQCQQHLLTRDERPKRRQVH